MGSRDDVQKITYFKENSENEVRFFNLRFKTEKRNFEMLYLQLPGEVRTKNVDFLIICLITRVSSQDGKRSYLINWSYFVLSLDTWRSQG